MVAFDKMESYKEFKTNFAHKKYNNSLLVTKYCLPESLCVIFLCKIKIGFLF